jgi:hypothetical protein
MEQDELLIKLGLVHVQGEYFGKVNIVFGFFRLFFLGFFTLPHIYHDGKIIPDW